jgi:hypothetical protein
MIPKKCIPLKYHTTVNVSIVCVGTSPEDITWVLPMHTLRMRVRSWVPTKRCNGRPIFNAWDFYIRSASWSRSCPEDACFSRALIDHMRMGPDSCELSHAESANRGFAPKFCVMGTVSTLIALSLLFFTLVLIKIYHKREVFSSDMQDLSIARADSAVNSARHRVWELNLW